MAEESLTFRAFGNDVSAGRMFGDLADKADDARNSIHDLGGESKDLDTRLEETRQHLRALIDDFERTGDTALFRDIRKDRSTIAMLESIRKEIRGIGDDGDDVGRDFGKNVTKGLGDTLGALPSQLKGAGIAALAGIAVAAAPVVGAAIGGAVLGGVGLGGIIGGVALAAQDERVKAAGTALGEHLMSGLKDAGKPFIGPLLVEFGTLTRAGDKFTDELADGFRKLAPLVKPLAEGIEGLVDELGPGLSDAFSAAQPAIRAIANELPEVGDALSDMLTSIADESDGGVEGLISLLHATEFLARATGDLIGQLEFEYKALVDVGAKLDEFKDSPLGIVTANLGLGFEVLTDESTKLKKGLGDATSAQLDLYLTMLETNSAAGDQVKALQDLASQLENQFDPTARLIHAQREVRDAQAAYTEAVRKHGRSSDEAKDAELRQAEAILRMNSAAATAAGTFGGRFPEALRKTLIEGGLTEDQLKDIEKRARAAHTALDQYADVYKATVILDQEYHRESAREHRASGGPVMAGTTYMVGENGPELVTFGANGYVHDAASTRSMLSGSSGGSSAAFGGGTVDVNVRIDSSGARDELAALVLKMLRVDAGFRASVASYVGAS